MAKRRQPEPIVATTPDGVRHVDTGVYQYMQWVERCGSHRATIETDGAERLQLWTLLTRLVALKNEAKMYGVDGNMSNAFAGVFVQAYQQFMQATGGKPTDQQAEIFLLGIQCGQALEALEVLPCEPDALRGKRSAAPRESRRQQQAEETEARMRDFEAAYYRHRKGRVSHSAAVLKAAENLDISESQAWRYAKDLGLTGRKKLKK